MNRIEQVVEKEKDEIISNNEVKCWISSYVKIKLSTFFYTQVFDLSLLDIHKKSQITHELIYNVKR